ncbi:hypothetical protein [Phaeobacter gallaeciensis]
MSQTLKALVRKGYAAERRQKSDQRSISYELTEAGVAAVTEPNPTADAIGSLPAGVQTALRDGLLQSLRQALAATRSGNARPAHITRRKRLTLLA